MKKQPKSQWGLTGKDADRVAKIMAEPEGLNVIDAMKEQINKSKGIKGRVYYVPPHFNTKGNEETT